MIELPEDVQVTLDLVGDELVFQNIVLLGIPGFHAAFLQKYHSDLYETEVQIFSFIVSTQAYSYAGIGQGDEFTFTDGVYTYTFSIDRPAMNHLIGYSKLFANLIDKVPL